MSFNAIRKNEILAKISGFTVYVNGKNDYNPVVFKADEEEQCNCSKCIASSGLTLIHNIATVESNIPLLRQHNFTELLLPYLKSTDKEDHLSALAILAAIVDEKESEIINSNRKVVKRLMKFLRRGMRTIERRFHGWSCKELATSKFYLC